MPARSLFWLIFLWLLQLAAPAAELRISFTRLPPAFFTAEEIKNFPANGQADAAAVLRKRGLELPEGSSAWYDAPGANCFLRSTPRDINLLARLIEDSGVLRPEESVKSVRVSIVCCAIPLKAVPEGFGPYSSLRVLDQTKLEIVDRRDVITRSGQRSKTDEIIPGAPRTDDPDPLPAMSKSLETEVNVGDDDEVIDVNLAYELRTPHLAPEGKTAEFKIVQQLMMRDGSVLLHELGVTDEKEARLIVLRIQTDLGDLEADAAKETQTPPAPAAEKQETK